MSLKKAVTGECAAIQHRRSMNLLRRLFSRENLVALFVCAVVILLIIMTVDTTPQWIYQSF